MTRLLLLFAFVASAFAADISGKWTFNVETDMGSGSPTFIFQQDGEKLSGTYNGQFGEAPITGKVSGEKVEFWFDVSPAGDKLTMKYSGSIDGNNQIKGTVDFGGQASGTFTAKKD